MQFKFELIAVLINIIHHLENTGDLAMERRCTRVIKDWIEIPEPFVIPINATEMVLPIQGVIFPVVYPISPLSTT